MSACAAKKWSRALPEALKRKRIVFLCIAALWLIADQLAKLALDAHGVGEIVYDSPLGFVDIVLVHNTGAAWGMFAGAQVALGIVSLIVCAAIALYALVFAKGGSWLGFIGLALVFAGGLGNAIDRFWHGYVIDMISTAFMDFPVFNVADIGVTVGVVLFIVSLLLDGRGGEDGAADQSRGNA